MHPCKAHGLLTKFLENRRGRGQEAPTCSCPMALQPEPELSVPEKQKQPVLRILQSREERRHGQLWTGCEAFCLTDTQVVQAGLKLSAAPDPPASGSKTPRVS